MPSPTEAATDPLPLEGGAPPGVLRTGLDPQNHAVTIDFDPRVISDEGVRRVAERLAPIGHQQYCKTILRLQGRASGAAEQKIERKAQQISGVRRARATFLGGVMTLTFDDAQLSHGQLLEHVRAVGAKVHPYEEEIELRPTNLKEWLAWCGNEERLETALVPVTFLLMLAGLACAHAGSAAAANWLYVGAYLAGGYFGVRAGLQSLRQLTIDVDLLMVLAALGAAFIGSPFEGAMLLFLFSLSNVLQGFAIDRSRKAIKSLMKLRPEKALVRRGGATVELPVAELAVGDILVVRPGESIALDSVIVEGSSAVDQSSLTGESIPVAKKMGDRVFAGTINQTGGLEVRVSKLAKDSTIEKLVRMVEEAQTEKAETQRFLDRAEQYYALGVILFTVGLIFAPLLAGVPFHAAFYRAMTVMVVASPCALIISTPASILSAIGGAARRGVLFKGGVHLERTASVKIVALDKTGTLTEGRPRVTQVIPCEGAVSEEQLLQAVGAVEAKSEHPLAEAIVREAACRALSLPACTSFQSVSGKGASGLVNGLRISVGNARYFESLGISIPETFAQRVAELQAAGQTCVIVGECEERTGATRLLGALAVADVLRPDAAEVVRQFKAQGIERVVMLTGDNARVAKAIAREAGIDEVHADLLPQDKVSVIKELKAIGPVAMVGDGVNDAPALATATVGIAMGAAGTDVAMETADVVLMSNNLQQIAFALALSKQARRIIFQNLTFALGVIIVLIISALGFKLMLPFGVVAHEGSTVLVCLNGLRMLAFSGPRGNA